MGKGTRVVCKNCGTEYVWGKKRKLSGRQQVTLLVCNILVICVLFIAIGYSTYVFDIPRSLPFFFDDISCVFGVLCISLLWPIIKLCYMKNGVCCPKCQSYKCVPSDTPVAKRLTNNK